MPEHVSRDEMNTPLLDLFIQLREVYTDDGCRIWWNSRNHNLLTFTPRELWQQGQEQAVRDEVERLCAIS